MTRDKTILKDVQMGRGESLFMWKDKRQISLASIYSVTMT
jgi:hypothetical protein